MKIERLWHAVEIIRNGVAVISARQVTYLRTYPALVALAAQLQRDPTTHFLQLAVAAYGWMPRVMRLDNVQVEAAVAALSEVQGANHTGIDSAVVEALAGCLYSIVGASKVLHFVKPNVYPIWDTKVERAWRRSDPSQYYMSQATSYSAYAQELADLCQHERFAQFCSEFRAAQAERLRRLRLPSYDISEVRIVESAAFELSGGEYEDN